MLFRDLEPGDIYRTISPGKIGVFVKIGPRTCVSQRDLNRGTGYKQPERPKREVERVGDTTRVELRAARQFPSSIHWF